MNKKGISPLIATVLLIGFTVALVLVVTTWGTDYLKGILSGTEKTTDIALRCSPPYLEFDVTSIDCGEGTFVIMNRGTEEIKKIKVIPYPDISKAKEEGIVLKSGDVQEVSGYVSSEVTKLEIFAYILYKNDPTPCAQASREVTIECEE